MPSILFGCTEPVTELFSLEVCFKLFFSTGINSAVFKLFCCCEALKHCFDSPTLSMLNVLRVLRESLFILKKKQQFHELDFGNLSLNLSLGFI